MKKAIFILKGTSFIWLPLVGCYIANAITNIIL